MEFVTLRNGMQIPVLGFGTWPLKGETLSKAVEYSYNAGCRLYDTANLYANEKDLGTAIKNLKIDRDSLFLTSKVDSRMFNGRKRFFFLNKASISKTYKKSCNRIGSDYLDLYLLHSPFKNYLKAYEQLFSLYEKGLVKAIGVCNFNILELEEINETFGEYPLVNQIELHPFNQQKEMISFCQSNKIQIEAYSPFTSGKALKELLENEILINLAKKHNKNVFQIILRWITHLNIIVIPCSSNKIHIEDNYNIFDFILSDDEMELIGSLDKKETYCNYTHVVV